MTQVSLEEARALAVQCHRAGRVEQAEGIYRQILAVNEQNADAALYLALAAQELARPDAAELRARATGSFASEAHRHNMLGNAAFGLGRVHQAIEELSRAVALDPNLAAA